MKSNLKRLCVLLLGAAAAAGCFCLGRFTAPAPESPPEPTLPVLEAAPGITVDSDRYLQLDADQNPNAQFSRYYPPDADRSHSLHLYCLDMENVRIALDSQSCFLEDALEAELVTAEDLYSWAQLDTFLGICTQYTGIRQGASYCVFRYPEYDLRFTSGVKSDSAEGWEVVETLYVCANPYAPEVPASSAQEDWGLTFALQSADSTGVTLLCTQSGGQQLDTLIVDWYYIYLPDFSDSIPRQDGGQDTTAFQPNPVIARDAETQIALDWSAIYGSIPPGEYVLSLKVSDVYDLDNRQDADATAFDARQTYYIPFTIEK